MPDTQCSRHPVTDDAGDEGGNDRAQMESTATLGFEREGGAAEWNTEEAAECRADRGNDEDAAFEVWAPKPPCDVIGHARDDLNDCTFATDARANEVRSDTARPDHGRHPCGDLTIGNVNCVEDEARSTSDRLTEPVVKQPDDQTTDGQENNEPVEFFAGGACPVERLEKQERQYAACDADDYGNDGVDERELRPCEQ